MKIGSQIAIAQILEFSINSKEAKSSKIIHDKIVIVSAPNVSKILVI